MSTADQSSTGPQSGSNAGASEASGSRAANWRMRLFLTLGGLVVAFVIWKASAAYFPRAWARFVADDVQGSLVSGWLWGLFYGLVFSAVPVIVLLQARRSVFSWPAKAVVVVVAVLLATPNLLTAAIVWGTNSSAHAGQRILDVDAPGFRAGTVLGVVVGVSLALLALALLANRRRLKSQLKDARDQLKNPDGGSAA